MKNDDVLGVRLPSKLLGALERERKIMGKKFGVEVSTSVVVRAILEERLRGRRNTKPSRRAAA